MEERRRELYQAIKKKVGERLTDEEIEKIIEQFDLENGNIPQIEITADPKKFENGTRRKNDTFVNVWNEKSEYKIETDVMKGDYEPGIDAKYQDANIRIPRETHKMSDFSVNQMQIAIVKDSRHNHLNGENYDKDSETIQIYLPEEREYPENVSFRQSVIEERRKEFFETIKKKVGERLTDEEIEKIVEQFDLENEIIRQLGVSSDPKKFEKYTIGQINKAEINVLKGDYEPVMDAGHNPTRMRTPKEMSDFSVNQIQIVFTKKKRPNYLNGYYCDRDSEIIQIYLPEEREYPENVSFRQSVIEERRKEFFETIKKKVGERLTDEEIEKIIEQFDLENENVPEVGTISDPKEFEKVTKRKDYTFGNGGYGLNDKRVYKTETDVLIGDYEPGIDVKDASTKTPRETHEMSDFSINQMQLVIVRNSQRGNHYDNVRKTIQIYLPEEREYPENVSFKQIMLRNGKSDLAIRNKQLSALEEEQVKISELEKLINRNNEKDIGE